MSSRKNKYIPTMCLDPDKPILTVDLKKMTNKQLDNLEGLIKKARILKEWDKTLDKPRKPKK